MLDGYPDILLARDVSEHLRVTVQQAYRLMSMPLAKGGIPAFKIGKSRRVRKEDYVGWLQIKLKGGNACTNLTSTK